ncbi:MAG: CDP-alcohol phosphatidyltransferase family protein [Deltaproteobacteria bacterium]|nr:CDP-alcohol phosphatidyltransferase family protein [Deltaproteobacteria bacterium]
MKSFVKDLFNVPNTMSLLRILGAPLIAFFWLGLDWSVAGLALGTVIGLTDMMDGMVARKLDQITELGALLDQLGDLVFESTCLIIAVMMGKLWTGWLILYLTREFTVMVVRSYVLGNGGSLPSTVLGKAKSSFLQWAFFLFFLGAIVLRPGTIPESWTMVGISPGQILLWIGRASILVGIGLGLLSAWSYLKAFQKFYVLEQNSSS